MVQTNSGSLTGKIIGTLIIIALLAIIFWLAKRATSMPRASDTSTTTPSTSINADWDIATTTDGFTYKYPALFPATYISPVDWPPQVMVTAQGYTCTPAGDESARAGSTTKTTINGYSYCVTKETGAAAGSVYTQYSYITTRNNRTLNFIFSLRFPQCDNYEEPKKTECKNEQASFSVDTLVDTMVGTLSAIPSK